MIWEHPYLLWLLLLIPLLAGLSYLSAKRRRENLQGFFSQTLLNQISNQQSAGSQRVRAVLLYIGLSLLIVGMAGPKIGSEIREVTREGVDLIVALDVSRSMQAEDVRPNRLDKARFEISSLQERLQGDRIGLILFTNSAFLQCPLTTDYSAFSMYLDLVSTDQFPNAGTNFNAPLEQALDAFENRGGQRENAAKVLLFFSDGEDHSPGIEQSLDKLREAGVYIYTVGLGSTSGAPVPRIDSETGRRSGYLTDNRGERVISRLESENLQKMAESGNGFYYEIRRGNDHIDDFTRQLAELERREFASEQFSDYANQYQYPVAAGLLLILVYFMIPAYKPAKVSSS